MNSLRRTAKFSLLRKPMVALAGLFLAHSALATIPLYQNIDSVEYAIPGLPPPQIDARAFDNENSFTIDYNTFHPGTPYYQTLNTYFFTNAGTLVANSPETNAFNSLFLGFGFQNFGVGYQFDHYNGIQDNWADTFYNPGTIRSASTIDGNGLLEVITIFNGGQPRVSQLTSYGKVTVAATNIINPGTVDVSVNGYIGLKGKNVDLTGGQLVVEPALNALGATGVGLSSIGAIGVDTNGDWNPGLDLGTTFALSSFIPIPPFFIDLTNSQSYLDLRTPSQDNNIYRYVFVENNSPDVPYNVYIDAPNTVSLGFAAGAAHVEWVANVTDPASGNVSSQYLYLTDDYSLGASTNNFLVNGVPINFSFLTSNTELLFGPQSPNFLPLTDAYMSNNYAAFNGTLVANSASTNISSANPHGTITNLPGQIYITASNELNLAFTTVSGPNYLNLNCTNQFDGSPGASIAAAFSDIALGVTNGTLVVSNVLLANLPNWSGTVQAFSSDWFEYVPGAGLNGETVTNEYKVMIVFSQLSPTTSPWIQNLFLHGTNELVISDHLNVFGPIYSDAKTVVLNTNQVGNGATSLDGELVWLGGQPFNANSGSGVQQFPNLLWLTNNGLIRVTHNANFGNATLPAYAVSTPAVPGSAATATLFESGANAVKMDRVTIGTNVYTFVGTITNRLANQVKIATTFDGTLGNLIAAINHGLGAGTLYSTNTHANPAVTAGPVVSHAFTVTARSAGTIGNSIPVGFTPATAAIDLTWSGATLMNGTDLVPAVANYTAFVNHGLIDDQGLAIWTTYLENGGGIITNGTGAFTLHSSLATLTNGAIYAGGDVLLAVTNLPSVGANTLVISNFAIQAGHKLTLVSTNISDGAVTNGNIWSVGATAGGGASDSGFNSLLTPVAGDLLGTTVTNIAPASKTVYNTWAGKDYGLSPRGFTNNLAVGHLVLDTFGPDGKVAMVFNGASRSNAMYVDLLELKDSATHGNATNAFNFPWLQINTNMVIYFAQAMENGVSVAQNIDNASRHGANGGRLRWIYTYAGYNSSTNIVYPDGSTNTFNAALAQSSTIDSDGDGIPNAVDPTPFWVPSELATSISSVNNSVKIMWSTIPNATNCIYYTTNMFGGNWMPFTNFSTWYFGNNVARTNKVGPNSFMSPQVYINNASLPDNSQVTNVWIFDTYDPTMPHYYQPRVLPWVNFGE